MFLDRDGLEKVGGGLAGGKTDRLPPKHLSFGRKAQDLVLSTEEREGGTGGRGALSGAGAAVPLPGGPHC